MNEKKSDTIDVAHVTLKILFIGILIGSTYWIMRPFLIPFVWAAVIVIATWPVLIKLQALFAGRRGPAVAVMALAILLMIIIPLTLAVLAIVNNAENIIARIMTLATSPLPSLPEWVGRIPIAGKKLAAQWSTITALSPEERSAMVVPYAKTALMWFIAQAGNIGMTILQLLLTTILAAILYAKGESIGSGIIRFNRRLAGQRGEDAAILAAKAIRGVALGIVLTAIMQTCIGAVGLVVTGVPGAAIWTAVMFMLCIAQLGPVLVLVPAVIWVYMNAGALWGTILLVFTIFATTLDNVIRPILIKKGADLPLLLVFAGVIGGLIAFGVIGLFIGPVVLAVTYTLLKVWVADSNDQEVERAQSE